MSICIATYQRPEPLTRLLCALHQLEFDGEPPLIDIVVVDNDPAASARDACRSVRMEHRCRWPIAYLTEERRGISYARNAAMAHAAADADFLAFLDDDETPSPRWLAELLHTQERYRADVVGGPVVPRFEQEPPEWVVKGRFFERRRRSTGAFIDRAATNNALVRAAINHADDFWFDERYALTGGEDTHFFRRLYLAGKRMVWCDEAVVEDWIPPQRVTEKWIIRRQYRIGTIEAAIRLELEPDATSSTWVIGVGRRCFHLLLLLVLFWNKPQQVQQRRLMAYGKGLLHGLRGMRNEDYRDGSA
ncbi:MAG: glycosyltransferase [Planctomycetota bacterium]